MCVQKQYFLLVYSVPLILNVRFLQSDGVHGFLSFHILHSFHFFALSS